MNRIAMRLQDVLLWVMVPQHLFTILLGAAPFLVLVTLVTLTNENIPRQDSTGYTQFLAIQTHNGDFTLADLLGRDARHPMITMDLTTVAVAAVTPWDVRVARYVLLGVALAAFLALVTLGIGTLGKQVLWFLFPAGLIFFTPANMFIYAMYDGISYFYPIFFSMAAFAVILSAPRGVISLGAACLLALLSSLSFTTGLLAWGGVFLGLIQRGYRHWGYYLGLVGLALFTLYLTVEVLVRGVDMGPVGGTNAYTTENLDVWLLFIAIYLGRMFYWGDALQIPQWIGLVGMGLWVAMLAVVMLRFREWRVATAWGGVAGYALLIGFSISIAWNNNNGLYAAMYSRYITFASLFWVAYVALLVYLLSRPQTEAMWIEQVITVASASFAVLLCVFYVFATFQLYDNNANSIKYADERCHLEYLFTRDLWRLADEDCVFTAVDAIDPLAENEVAMFADLQAETIPQVQLAADLPIILSTHDGRINFQTQKWLLADVPQEQVLHLAPEAKPHYTDQLTRFNMPDTPTLETDVAAFVGESEAFWYIYRDGHEASDVNYHPVDITAWFAEDYDYVEETYTTWADVSFQTRLYVRRPTNAVPVATFEDQFDLLAVNQVGELRDCTPITVLTHWQLAATEAPNLAYSASLFIMDADGNVLTRTDSQLGVLPTFAWEPATSYADARSLSVPCDLEAGTYRLAWRVYNAGSGSVLLPTGDAAEQDYTVLGSFTVP